ncbi:MAG TPA: SAM-dependent methyltransferase [Albitalea sp.]|uniref:SAM-dependent methyltransferase n=1 Tax=Piscinibacter sp. TaxID=1903157 RepID=UPI002ED2B719
MTSGRLILVPNTLDFGTAAAGDLTEVLPLAAIRTAAGLGHWVAENAKTLRAFLKRVDAVQPLARPLQAIAIVEMPRPPKGATAPAAAPLDALLAPALAGEDLGLMSEAGMPAIADPGAELVRAAHRLQVPVLALPGPSSLLLALASSGLNGQSFAFVGYLPVDAAARATRIRELETLSRRTAQTQLVIETPYRNEALLAGLLAALSPQTRLSVSCGLTLPGGWTRSDTVAHWKAAPATLPKDIPAVFAFLAG